MHSSALNIGSPKRDKRRMSGWEGFSPYYAGYPEHFAHALLTSADLNKHAIVFDPWNGSGTTTYVATKLGHTGVGFDLNPVMVIVAKARMLPGSEADSLEPLALEILRQAANADAAPATDPLHEWFDQLTASSLRAIESGIRSNLVGRRTISEAGTDLNNISLIASAFYAALFATARELTARFRSSNPTWLRKPRRLEDKASAERGQVFSLFRLNITGLATALAERLPESESEKSFRVELGDSTKTNVEAGSVDFVLTSPPYCTRIEYTTATAIQLAVMHPLLNVGVRELGQHMLGTTQVPRRDLKVDDEWGNECGRLLEKIERHPSKASSTYYLKTHIDYFDKLYRSLCSVSKAMRRKSNAVLVVQDSYYKDVHNDLQKIVTDMCTNTGMELSRREDFLVKATLATSNPKSRSYRATSGATESVLIFVKQ